MYKIGSVKSFFAAGHSPVNVRITKGKQLEVVEGVDRMFKSLRRKESDSDEVYEFYYTTLFLIFTFFMSRPPRSA